MKRITRFKPSKPRRYLPWRVILAVGLSVGIAFELGYGVFFLPLFHIQSIRVEGDAALPVADIQALVDSIAQQKLLGFLSKQNILFFESNAIASAIRSSFFKVGRVAVNKDWQNRAVRVEISPRKEVAIWCQVASVSDGTAPICSYIDEAAFIFAPAPRGSGGILSIITDARSRTAALGAQVVEPAVLVAILDARTLLTTANYTIDSIILRPSRDVVVHVNGSFTIIFTLDEPPARQVDRLKSLIEFKLKDDLKKVDYIDLRIGNRIFYKLKDVVQ